MRTEVNAFLRGSMRVLGLAVVAAMMAACERTMIGEDWDALRNVNGSADVNGSGDASGAAGKQALKVKTRSGDGEATVSYPVQVYVFQGEACKAVQTITSADDDLSISLVEGSYSVYAIGGASAEDYDLPTEDTASPTTALTLKDGKNLTDLMAASAEATLVDGGTNVVTLALQRKVMLLQAITIRQVPTAATAVTVTIAPLSENLTVSGGYSGDDGATTVSLTRGEDGRTWTMDTAPAGAGGFFLLPPSGSEARIGIVITEGGATKSFSYVTSELAANHKVIIDGTYTEAVAVSLTGTITGVAWLDDSTISFEFDDNNATGDNNDNSNHLDDFPQAGDTYEGCFVLAATVATDGETAELTLLSPNEKPYTNVAGVSLDFLQTKAAEHGTDGISGWRLMTRSEAGLLQAAHTALGIDGTCEYLFDDSGTAKQMLMSNGTVSALSNGAVYVRPVATVTVSKE